MLRRGTVQPPTPLRSTPGRPQCNDPGPTNQEQWNAGPAQRKMAGSKAIRSTRALRTFLHQRLAGIEAVTKRAAGAAPATRPAPATRRGQANRAGRRSTSSAPQLCNGGRHRGPPGLLLPSHSRYPLATCPLIFDNRTPHHNRYAITVSKTVKPIP